MVRKFPEISPKKDGVPGARQCPIMNSSLISDFTADRPGTYWYHGHYSSQYPDGQIGPLIIDPLVDPYQSMYNNELILLANDYYSVHTVDLIPGYMSPGSGGNEPMPDAIAVNNYFSGKFPPFFVGSNKKLLVRFINAAALSMYNVSFDGLNITIIGVDSTNVKPYKVPWVLVNVAQRVNFIVDFDTMDPALSGQNAIYFRSGVVPDMYPAYNSSAPYPYGLYGAGSCFKSNAFPANCNSSNSLGFNTSWSGEIQLVLGAHPTYTVPPINWPSYSSDYNLLNAQLLHPDPAPTPDIFLYQFVEFYNDMNGTNHAYVNGQTFPGYTMAQLETPQLKQFLNTTFYNQYYDGPKNVNLNGSGTVNYVLPYNKTIELLINNTDGGAHPFHLHGGDFWIVESSDNPLTINGALHNPNYLIRDTVTVPPMGYVKIRWATKNPGGELLF